MRRRQREMHLGPSVLKASFEAHRCAVKEERRGFFPLSSLFLFHSLRFQLAGLLDADEDAAAALTRRIRRIDATLPRRLALMRIQSREH